MTPIGKAAWQLASPWGATGYVAELDGPVHWIDFGGPKRKPPVVFVHGLGGSHLNWALIGEAVAKGHPTYALDLHGFGLTPGVKANSTIQANARLVDTFLREIVGRPATLIGNSMGGLISILSAAANPAAVERLILIDPALPLPRRLPDPGVAATFLVYAVPGIGKVSMKTMQARSGPDELVNRIVKLCFADPSRASADMRRIAADLVRVRREIADKEEAFLSAARSLMRLLMLPRRYEKMMDAIAVPVLLMHGRQDRLVAVEAAETAAKARPSWSTVFLDDVGHTPQLEKPVETARIINEWLARTA